MRTLLIAALLAIAPVATGQAETPAPTAPETPSLGIPGSGTPDLAAAGDTDADPALWVVRDEDTNIYLFGTFHLLDRRPWFNDEVRAAFDLSDELVIEAIIPEEVGELQAMVQRYAVDPEGRRLSERLTAKENAALAAALARLDAPAALFDRLEPWFVALTLASIGHQQLQIDAENGPERVLSRAARERGMPIGELEGVERQIRLFDTMPEAQQMAQLRQTIGEVDRMAEMLAPLLAAWSAGNVDELVDILNTHSEQDPALHRLLFTERNAAWAEWIAQRLERPGTVFVAVGAGHLAGDDSVQAVLGARGLLAERVPRAGAATIAAR